MENDRDKNRKYTTGLLTKRKEKEMDRIEELQ